MLTVQQAAGTQFHSLLSIHSILTQGELFPMTKRKHIKFSLFNFANKILQCTFIQMAHILNYLLTTITCLCIHYL